MVRMVFFLMRLGKLLDRQPIEFKPILSRLLNLSDDLVVRRFVFCD